MGINDSKGDFYVNPIVIGISIASAIFAIISNFWGPEKLRNLAVYFAYWLLLIAVGTLSLTTGGTSSPFVALWMISSIFAGIFGPATLTLLLIAVSGFIGLGIYNNGLNSEMLLNSMLVGALPILVSYILWHGKSNSEKSKEREYYDLADELSQVANKSEVVINAISDGVIAINNQGVIELINPTAQRIIGWGHQDAINLDYKSVLQLLSKDSHELDKSTDPVFNVISTNQPTHRNDLQLQTNSGKKINIDIVISPIGRLGSGAIIVFRDVTKEQAEGKAQTEFISTASHEMRTPVASIEGYLGLALNPATATIDSRARDFITKAHESAQHLGRLFQDLLDITKADDGRLSNNPKVVEMIEFTDTIIEGLQPKANEKNLRIFFKQAADNNQTNQHSVNPVYYTNLDSDHLREVFSNLIENAIKYTLKGQIVVDVKGDDAHVVVSISDSGIGIPAEDIPHLFQKFYRVDNSDTREIGGTGLGLYLCRRLVETMGGRIWVESEYKKGSTFSVELPRISYEEANRLIEASIEKSPQINVSKVYLSNNPNTSTTQDNSTTMPISMESNSYTSANTTSATTQLDDVAIVDPLIGGSNDETFKTEPNEPLRSTNATILPPEMQEAIERVRNQQATAPYDPASVATQFVQPKSLSPSQIPQPQYQPTTIQPQQRTIQPTTVANRPVVVINR
ncbi:MAG: ATP-binding protein [Candidatus Saccharimonadales bacterium]